MYGCVCGSFLVVFLSVAYGFLCIVFFNYWWFLVKLWKIPWIVLSFTVVVIWWSLWSLMRCVYIRGSKDKDLKLVWLCVYGSFLGWFSLCDMTDWALAFLVIDDLLSNFLLWFRLILVIDDVTTREISGLWFLHSSVCMVVICFSLWLNSVSQRCIISGSVTFLC